MSRSTERSENTPDPVGASSRPHLACFLRWALSGGGLEGSGDSYHGKVEVRCRECGELFVRYVYEKTVRCPACRGNRRRLSEKVET